MYFALLVALAAPADWVPARWKSADPASLDLLRGTPVNCLLVDGVPAEFASKAAALGIATLAVVRPGNDAAKQARDAVAAGLAGVVLEGDFADTVVDSRAPVVELTSRGRMKLGSPAPILGTFQGVWPGIAVMDDGHAKAGPTGSAWIDTNSGFIRSARAYGNAALWIANRPPPGEAVTTERYLQVISDAAIAGARWVVSLDDRLSERLFARDAAALASWKAIAQYLKYFEDHREWRAMQPYGKLAIVQDAASGSLLSGGILDMIAVKHTPVRAVPPRRLSPEALKGAEMAVNVDKDALDAAQTGVLRDFARGGATLLTAPPGWKDRPPLGAGQITLEKAELERLNEIWKEVSGLIGRRNLGARLFNVSTMLSNMLGDGKRVVVHLVNYSGYPVENVTVHVLGNFQRARLLTPEGEARNLEVYRNEEGTGVDIDKVSVCATLQLE